MKAKLLASVLVLSGLLLALAACAGGDSSLSPTTATPGGCPAAGGQNVTGLVGHLELEPEGYAYGQGQAVTMTLFVTNCGQQAETLYFRDAQRYEFRVLDEGGNEVWRWSADKLFAQVLGEETIQAGEDVSYSEAWDQRGNDGQQVPPGRYEIFGLSVHCDRNLENCGFGLSIFVDIVP